jgi:hypothetical protein
MKVNGKAIGVIIILAVVAAGVLYMAFKDRILGGTDRVKLSLRKVETVSGAVGGGKENFIADPDFVKILKDDYRLEAKNEPWSNGKIVKDDVRAYDFLFFSDQRFFDYYKLQPDPAKGESERAKVLKGGMTLNTPIVIYSWDKVADALIAAKLVVVRNGTYYLTGMEKLLAMISAGKEWKDLGLTSLYGKINIASTDPVTSSPGATYYGLLVSIMNGGSVDETNFRAVLPRLKAFYVKSGYMNQSPADLFESYLRTGMGARPMIVDYEKSLVDFAVNNPEGWAQVKDRVRVLYPEPTIWNSHCLATLTEKGNAYLKAFDDKRVQDIAWKKYGFRVGLSGGSYNVADIAVPGLPASVDAVVPALQKGMYDEIIAYLGKKE